MNWSNIICIEIKKYNNQQLDVICEQLNFPLGSLIEFKDSGSTRLYWEKDKPYVIGSVKKEDLREKFHKPLYKGLYLNTNYSHLSQKDKDKLLKIQPTDFKTKKNTKVFVESIKDSNKKMKLTTRKNKKITLTSTYNKKKNNI